MMILRKHCQRKYQQKNIIAKDAAMDLAGTKKQMGGFGFPDAAEIKSKYRSEERRVGKECRSRWSPYH